MAEYEVVNGLFLLKEEAPQEPVSVAPEVELCRVCGKPATKQPSIIGNHLDWPRPSCGHGAFLRHFECYEKIDEAYPPGHPERSAQFDRYLSCPVCGCGGFYC